jgi:hypothetical protein
VNRRCRLNTGWASGLTVKNGRAIRKKTDFSANFVSGRWKTLAFEHISLGEASQPLRKGRSIDA